jgi:arsenic resistance protein ArsH
VAAEGGSRLRPSGNRDRIVDYIEELVKYTLIMRYYFDLFNDRFSERAERQANYNRSATNKAEQAQAGGEGNVKTVGSADVVNGIDVAGI